ncbi:hypothetical protein TEA_028946 [Camellia sinensis var. sinensis]|uniref:Uncharacterized protein n=1 Tax=Camellia sinensis var. sinensis TaxID=542762 RepID=A0A4V6RYL4_CAMSN|nr:hypothetical protein TEA_028946 [Camellia sinensis var. sinensis]
MKPPRLLSARPTNTFFITTSKLAPNARRVCEFGQSGVRFPATMTTRSRPNTLSSVRSLSQAIEPDTGSGPAAGFPGKLQEFEENIEKAIYRCRFLAIFAVWGSLVGSFLCFIKGSTYVVESFKQYLVNRVKVIFLLVESIDVYLLGTVMLVFGMGLYELFISTLEIAKLESEENIPYRSNLFGLFALKRWDGGGGGGGGGGGNGGCGGNDSGGGSGSVMALERPKWLEIKTINELKTKLGHVIVMLLLIGLLDKSKKAVIHSPVDLLCFSASVLLSSGSLYLLSKLNGSN